MTSEMEKIQSVLMSRPDVLDVLKRALEIQRENQGNEYWLGFEWYEVAAAPQTLNWLVRQGILEISYKSNKCTCYRIRNLQLVEAAIAELSTQTIESIEEEGRIPEDLFEIIKLHDDKKEILWRAIRSEKPVHVLLVGTVSSAKTMFLMELKRLPRSEFCLGSSLTRAGIIDLMFTKKPRYLIIDEIDKVSDNDNLTALLSLMQTGVISETKFGRHRKEVFKTWVFAGANYEYKIPPELRSRFTILRFREYNDDEFMEVTTHVLVKMEGASENLAEYIAYKVLNEMRSRDVRDAIKVFRLLREKTRKDVDKVISILASNRG
ncbi:MAG: hypothetical protein DRI01_04560 [Chloroflexi bacterium]|nr:MAG: hypothetical protein DRI01_04560 [Chloroflexota bacterium]